MMKRCLIVAKIIQNRLHSRMKSSIVAVDAPVFKNLGFLDV